MEREFGPSSVWDVPDLRIAQDAAADELLSRDPLALLIGMLLDQHVSRGAVGTRAFCGRFGSAAPERGVMAGASARPAVQLATKVIACSGSEAGSVV